ncbi:MAG: hypothetical protein H8E25_15000 [Planctomycetes bacterium]|nr:hypothetical protein [Planctomycetota bacterium]
MKPIYVCLGWGSLVWDPRDLPIIGDWHQDGPSLRLEFSRVSMDGRLTLVLDPTGLLVPSLWCCLNVQDMQHAVEVLASREGIPLANAGSHIGRWSADLGGDDSEIAKWAEDKQVAGVVWTNLPPKFDNENGRVPSCDEALNYLSSLDSKSLIKAKEYVLNTPAQIQTKNRTQIEKMLQKII